MVCGYASCSVRSFFFFFFQAEDGIRDTSVTGVQTCALPIYFSLDVGNEKFTIAGQFRSSSDGFGNPEIGRASCGKECRSRWGTCHEKEKEGKKRGGRRRETVNSDGDLSATLSEHGRHTRNGV